MNANLASIMPQVLGVWCEAEGHEVTFVCYTGLENLLDELPDRVDLVFIGAFTEAAFLAYALSNLFRQEGAITVLGGPHARCYPEDAAKYFDYVVGLTDQIVIREVLRDCSPHQPMGLHLTAKSQPATLPGVRERWKFIEPTLRKAPVFKMVPMLGSLGCPYTCSFCIDSVVAYQPLDFAVLSDDLRFLLRKFRRPRVGWHDPNFGVRFDQYLDAIEAAVPTGTGSISSRKAACPCCRSRISSVSSGADSRSCYLGLSRGTTSATNRRPATKGMDKVRQVSDHVNMILRYVPYVQTNFVLGLDSDEGEEPFELTKRFVDLTPGAFPGYSLLSAFGRAAPLNLQYQREDRVLPFPFHFLNNNHAMNIQPKNYSWRDFYDRVISLTNYSFSGSAIVRRFRAGRMMIPRGMNVVRAVSSEGFGRLRWYAEVRRRLDDDGDLRRYFDQETTELPSFYVDQVRNDLGPLWDWLPPGALDHDPNAYRKSEEAQLPTA